MNEKEFRIRRRHKMFYEFNKEFFESENLPDFQQFHLKNIKILEEYEKNDKKRQNRSCS
tara:strand:- start:624 stop:800 length:177 start_codon:yes stop_codon:yes gene_type:complete